MTRHRRARRFSARVHQQREQDRRLGRRQPPADWRDGSVDVGRNAPLEPEQDATADPFYPRGLDW